MNKLSIFIWGSFFLFLTINAEGQQSAIDFNADISICRSYLIAAGLENIEIQPASNETVRIAYENRRYRNEVTALGLVLNYATACFSTSKKFVIIPKSRNIAVKYLGVDRETFNQFIHNQITASEFIAHLVISYEPTSAPLQDFRSAASNTSFFKFDIAVSPGWKAQLAQPNDPAQLQFNFLADFSFAPAPGMWVTGQLVVPFYNEFQRPEGQSRLGTLQINQFIRLPSSAFLSFSAGMFEYGCYGISSQIKQILWHDRLSFSARGDWIQTHSLNRWLPLNSPCQNDHSYLLKAEYRFESIDFRAGLTWGRYLLGDEGWRIDVLRKFRELELGFMGVWNQSLEFLTGMTLRIPFPVSRQAYPGRVRLCTPKFIPWSYRYLPCYDGLILDTGTSYEEIADQLTTSFIRANINQLKSVLRYVKLNESSSYQKLLAESGPR